MRITSSILLTSIFLVQTIYGQEQLIPNGGFESHRGLPEVDGDFSKLRAWFNPSIDRENNFNFGTPDFFHMKALGDVKMPFTKMGTVFAKSGQACSGLILYADSETSENNFREYVAIELSNPIRPGRRYEFSLHYTNGSDKQYGYYECRSLGVGFSRNRPAQEGHSLINVDENVKLEGVQFDIDWRRVKAVIEPSEEYRYLIIGNFWNDDNTEVSVSALANSHSRFSYVFLDDISLIELTETSDKTEEISPDTIEGAKEVPVKVIKYKTDTVKVIKEVPVEVIKYKTDTVEVIKEVPVEVIKYKTDTVEVIKEVPVEVVKYKTDTVEVIKEVPVEVIKYKTDTVELIKEIPVEVVGNAGKQSKGIETEPDTNEPLRETDIPLDNDGYPLSPSRIIFKGPESLVENKVFVLNRVIFERNSIVLVDSAMVQLDMLGGYMKANPDMQVELFGHTSDEGNPKLLQKLSEDRAMACKSYLVTNWKINPQRVITRGFGKYKKWCTIRTDYCRIRNRRVELIIQRRYFRLTK